MKPSFSIYHTFNIYSAGDYARILSPPESFLAAARSVVSSRAPGSASATNPVTGPAAARRSPKARPDEPPKTTQRVTKEEKVPPKPKKVADIHPPRPIQKPTVSSGPKEGPKVVSTPASSAKSPAAPSTSGSFTSAPLVIVKTLTEDSEDQGSEAMCLGYPEEGPSSSSAQAATADTHATEDTTKKSQPAPPSEEPTASKVESEPISIIVEKPQGMLLDVSTITPEQSPSQAQHDTFLTSPAFQDLEGIDFRNSEDTTASEKTSNELEKTEYFDTSHTEVCNDDEESVEYLQRGISVLSEFLESTKLEDVNCQKTENCRRELEVLLKKCLRAANQLQGSFAHGEQPSCESESTTIAVPFKTTPSDVETPFERTPAKHDRSPSVSQLEDSPSFQRLKKAVTAPPFYPRSSSFSGYRSPINSIASDSTSPPPTPVPTRSRAIPIMKTAPPPADSEAAAGHIFGDHLLPGRRSLDASSKSISSILHTSDGTSKCHPLI